ncbi:MAG TPA: hypothetical protein VLV16_06985 [Gemmatimonadales bacterium]|nr:hypothetical protein [Gemmatimonadales bacterium]
MRFCTLLFSAAAAVVLACDQNQVPTAPIISLHKTAPPPPPTDPSCASFVASHHRGNPDSSIALICAIQAPGPTNLAAGTKGWVDGDRYYLTDQSNAGLDVFDANNLAFLFRVGGMIGNAGAGGGTATTNGAGPSSVVLDRRGRAWVSDGNSTLYVVDVDHVRQIVATINTSIPACDHGTATTHYCGRTNEITYDPLHDLIFVQNPSALDTAAPHNAIDTYATFISARPPYHIVGTISFPDRRGQEAPLWDPGTRRIVTAVSGRQVVTGGVVTALFHQYVAVINPRVRPFVIEHEFDIDCTALGIVGTPTTANPTGRQFGINDPALGRHQHMVIPACGRPFIMNARTGAFINTGITQVGGGNETTYGSGDDNFYTAVGGFVGVIDARTAQWKQNVTAAGVANPAAFAEGRNYVFVIVQAAATPTVCTAFGYQATGCIAVYGHTGTASGHHHDGDDDDDDGGYGHGHEHGHD